MSALDGNAAAGVLSEVFGVEMTTALGTCRHCGTQGALGTALVYMGGPGTVLRCAACEGLLMRFAEIDGRMLFELQGVRCVEVPAS